MNKNWTASKYSQGDVPSISALENNYSFEDNLTFHQKENLRDFPFKLNETPKKKVFYESPTKLQTSMLVKSTSKKNQMLENSPIVCRKSSMIKSSQDLRMGSAKKVQSVKKG